MKENEQTFFENNSHFCVDEKYLSIDYDDRYIVDFGIKYYPCGYIDGLYPTRLPMVYYYEREDILKKIPFKKDDFYKFDILQDSIKELGLNPESLFEFLVFLYGYIDSNAKLRLKKFKTSIDEANEFILENFANSNLRLTLQAGRKKMNITQSECLYALLSAFHPEIVCNINTISFDRTEYSIRRRSYMMVKNLEAGLTLKIKKSENVLYTNKERNFYLRILYLCKYLLGDPTSVCYAGSNSATFNKLMRDFKGVQYALSGF